MERYDLRMLFLEGFYLKMFFLENQNFELLFHGEHPHMMMEILERREK